MERQYPFFGMVTLAGGGNICIGCAGHPERSLSRLTRFLIGYPEGPRTSGGQCQHRQRDYNPPAGLAKFTHYSHISRCISLNWEWQPEYQLKVSLNQQVGDGTLVEYM
jgi:hypothetical protein